MKYLKLFEDFSDDKYAQVANQLGIDKDDIEDSADLKDYINNMVLNYSEADDEEIKDEAEYIYDRYIEINPSVFGEHMSGNLFDDKNLPVDVITNKILNFIEELSDIDNVYFHFTKNEMKPFIKSFVEDKLKSLKGE